MEDLAWLSLRARWGSNGSHPGRTLFVEPDTFFAELTHLRQVCVEFDVGIDWDEWAGRLVASQIDLRRGLVESMQQEGPGLTQDDLLDLLDEGRFRRGGNSRPCFGLRDFQLRDIAILLALPYGANFSVPGAGKTAVTYAVYESERVRNRVVQMLIVAPLSAFEAWRDEARECFPAMPSIDRWEPGGRTDAEILLVNYQRLEGGYDDLAEYCQTGTTHIVLDEAHRIKRGRTGQWGRNALNLAHLGTRRDILTGTPAPQASSDLEALFEFVWPGQHSLIFPAGSLTDDPTHTDASAASNAIRPLYARTTKDELDLPKVDVRLVPVRLGPLQAEIYEALCGHYEGSFSVGWRDRMQFAHFSTVVMYLLEAATNPALLVAGSSDYDPIVFRHPPFELLGNLSLMELLRTYPNYEFPAKLEVAKRIVASNANASRKTLIWSNFVRNIESLARELEQFQPAIVHGGMPLERDGGAGIRSRSSEISRFRQDPDCWVLLANPAACGEGISLHDVCHEAVYLERTFNAGQYLQSIDRIHRLGLKKDVGTRVQILSASGTIDSLVEDRLRIKVARLGQLLDDPSVALMSLPDEEIYGDVLDSRADADAIVAHITAYRDS